MDSPDSDTAALLADLAAAVFPPLAGREVLSRRAQIAAIVQRYGPAPRDDVDRMDMWIAGPSGRLRVRIHRSRRSDGGLQPLLINMHGGGWALGDPDIYDGAMSAYAAAAGCVVVDVDYRRAPENLWPAAFDDCLAALEWAAGRGPEIGGDPTRIFLTGDSAGGYLATLVGLRTTLEISGLVLVYPVMAVGTWSDFASRHVLGDGRFFITEAAIKNAQADFFPPALDLDDPALNPLLQSAAALQRLPPTLMITASLDPLKDEAASFVTSLNAAGNIVEHIEVRGTIHGFVLFAGAINSGKMIIERIGEWLRLTAGR